MLLLYSAVLLAVIAANAVAILLAATIAYRRMHQDRRLVRRSTCAWPGPCRSRLASPCGCFPIRFRTASRILAWPCFCILCLRASIMLMTGAIGLPSAAISTSGARCSTFAFTSSWMARAYSSGIFSGSKRPLIRLINSLAKVTDSVSGFVVSLSK